MIQDIYPKIYHNEYHDVKPAENDFIFVFYKNTVLLRFWEGKLRYPTLKEMAGLPYVYYYLFCIDNYKYFLAFFLCGRGSFYVRTVRKTGLPDTK